MEAPGNLPALSHAKIQPIKKDRPGICSPVKYFTQKMRITQTLQAPFCWSCCTLRVLHRQHGVSAVPGCCSNPSEMSCSGAGGGWERGVAAHHVFCAWCGRPIRFVVVPKSFCHMAHHVGAMYSFFPCQAPGNLCIRLKSVIVACSALCAHPSHIYPPA